MEESVWADSIK